MREKIEENLQVVDLAKAAMQDLGIEPRVEPHPRRNGRLPPLLHGPALPEPVRRRP